MKITLTKDHLMMGMSARGAWNATQFHILGIKWPPHKGWMKQLLGKKIDRDVYRKFLDAKTDRNKDFIDKNPFGAKHNTVTHGYGPPRRKWDTKP